MTDSNSGCLKQSAQTNPQMFMPMGVCCCRATRDLSTARNDSQSAALTSTLTFDMLCVLKGDARARSQECKKAMAVIREAQPPYFPENAPDALDYNFLGESMR